MRERNWDMSSGSLMETHMTQLLATGVYNAIFKTLGDIGQELKTCLLMGELFMLM